MNLAGAGVVDLHGMAKLAAAVWEQSRPGDVIWLTGELGSGKTTFVRELCQVAGSDQASSPTYSLVQEYDVPEGLVLHVDCYRLNDPAEAMDLDLDRQSRNARLTLVEWPQRGGEHVPAPSLRLSFSHVENPDCRKVETT